MPPFVANNFRMKNLGIAADKAEENDEISFRKIKIKTSFQVKYEIATK
jgi:hypothetical protein